MAYAVERTPYDYRADPAVPRFADDRPIIIFDGKCVLCSWFARFVLRTDRTGRFRLLAAQSVLATRSIGTSVSIRFSTRPISCWRTAAPFSGPKPRSGYLRDWVVRGGSRASGASCRFGPATGCTISSRETVSVGSERGRPVTSRILLRRIDSFHDDRPQNSPSSAATAYSAAVSSNCWKTIRD